jgi:hypothetical protein
MQYVIFELACCSAYRDSCATFCIVDELCTNKAIMLEMCCAAMCRSVEMDVCSDIYLPGNLQFVQLLMLLGLSV